ncbi:MAG TPA: hypothetical protein VM452_17490 [Caulifigura sp.]|jgi:hypothetical protein|nr:hypothetical protein [Caulifigura sp.]
MTTSTAQPGQPWARASGLLGGCATTIAGVAQSVDPDVIVYRATVAAITVAVIARVFVLVCQSNTPTIEDDE